MRERPRSVDVAKAGALVARTALHVAAERLLVRKVTDTEVTPPRIEAVTPRWLTGALCGRHGDGHVVAVEIEGGSSGTSVRRTLRLQYNAAGTEAGLPPSLFAKSTPTVLTRVVNGISGSSRAEAGFYRELRPLLELEAPLGYFSSVDPRSFRSIHLLEDLVATRNATFTSAATPVARSDAEEMVDLLVHLHTRPREGLLRDPPRWLRSYRVWWEDAIAVADIKKAHLTGFDDAADLLPAPLRGQGIAAWDRFVDSVHDHSTRVPSLIHNDVHIGNWYRTGDGRMGLCDWQCVAIGDGSRDLAYCLSTALSVENRRAWESDLIDRYRQGIAAAGRAEMTMAEAFGRYRGQLAGALMMWTPTYSPPRFFPDMQPREIAEEMLVRITTAINDLDALRPNP